MKPSRSIRAFTLLEIMVVVAIIGVIFLMGIPAIREAAHREALSQATRDMAEACKQARQRAILGSKPAELRIFLSHFTKHWSAVRLFEANGNCSHVQLQTHFRRACLLVQHKCGPQRGMPREG